MRKTLSLLSAALVLCSCSCTQGLTPKQQTAIDVFNCRVQVLTPYIGDALDVESLVRDAIAGKTDPATVLLGLGATVADVKQAARAWSACAPTASSGT